MPRAPRVGRCGKQAIDNGYEANRADDGSGRVGTLPSPHATLRHQPRDEDERQRRDRQVDEEGPAPGCEINDDAADDGTEDAPKGGDAAGQPECSHSFGRVGEHDGDETERRWRGERFTAALHEAGGDEKLLIGRAPAGRRSDSEEPNADQKHPSSADEVSGSTAQQQQSSRHQHVGVDHPREPGGRESEITLHLWERDVHDGDVEAEHELNEGEHSQGFPAPRVRSSWRSHTADPVWLRHQADSGTRPV